MALTAQQANAALENVTTVDQLRNLINQLSIEASGKTTILYSGVSTTNDLVSNQQVIQGMLHNGDDIRVIDKTEAAKFLDLTNSESATYNQALAEKMGQLGISGKPSERGSASNKFLFGDVDANGTRVPNGAWDNVSARFVDPTAGEVRTLTGGANAERVFGQTEIPHVLTDNSSTFSLAV